MIASEKITTLPFRTALLRHYIATAFIDLMIRVNGEAAYIEDGERIPLNPERVAINIIYHIEAPWIEEFGADDGLRLAAEALEKCCYPALLVKNSIFPLPGFVSCVKYIATSFSVRQMVNCLKVWSFHPFTGREGHYDA